MEKMPKQGKKLSENSLETLKQKMDEIVSSEKAKGNERLTQLKADLDDYLRQLSSESDARKAQNKIDAINRAIENNNKQIREMDPNWPLTLQNKFKDASEKLLIKTIENIMATDYNMADAVKKHFPDPPKI